MAAYPTPVVRKTLFEPAARTTHESTTKFEAKGRNLRVDIDISAFTGTSITFTLEYFDHSKNDWISLLASSAQTGAAHVELTVGPDLATSANVALKAILPRDLRLTPSGTIVTVTYGATATWGN